jgi:hypothetical protein
MAVVRTDVSEDRSASIIKVTRIGKLGTTLAVTSNRRTRLEVYENQQNLELLSFIDCGRF